jgi:hypothetical protein
MVPNFQFVFFESEEMKCKEEHEREPLCMFNQTKRLICSCITRDIYLTEAIIVVINVLNNGWRRILTQNFLSAD